MHKNNYVLIIAGGIGSRFWPVSRVENPKQFQDFMGRGKTLIQETYDRVIEFTPKENIFILTNKLYKKKVVKQIKGIVDSRIVLEPSIRNTAPCILYASLKIKKINPSAKIVVTPSDHLIDDKTAFKSNILQALNYISLSNRLVTFGIIPTRPETGYGYIQFEKSEGKIYRVKKFIEKPKLSDAKKYLKSQNYMWNSGIFVWKVDDIIDAFKKYQSKMFKILSNGMIFFNTVDEKKFIDKNYHKLDNISIDYAIMEKTNNCSTIKADFKWNDLGRWGAIYDLSRKDSKENVIIGSKGIFNNLKGNFIFNESDRLFVAEGLENKVIIITNDLLLIYPKGDDEKLKTIVEEVKNRFGKKFN